MNIISLQSLRIRKRIRNLPSATVAVKVSYLAWVASVAVTRP